MLTIARTHAQLDANIVLGTVNAELKQLDKAFKDILGVRPRLFAPPAGMINRESRKSRDALIWLMAKDYTSQSEKNQSICDE